MQEINSLISKLNKASIAYYKYDKPIMTDKQYDDLYIQLEKLESTTGIIMSNSPTQKVQGEILEGLQKVKHSKPMLSANKTKDLEIIKTFAKYAKTYVSWKLDGLTLVVRYKNGKLNKVLTRGSGDYGEDVTKQSKMIINLPLEIPYNNELELRGECVISWNNFNVINENLYNKFSTPRNLSAGSIRTLNTESIKDRFLEFIVFEVVSPLTDNSKLSQLSHLNTLGFTTVDRLIVDNNYDTIINKWIPEKSKYPVDGLIFEYDDLRLSESLGSTSHHENCRIAFKWKDETAESILTDIEWTMGKTGVLTPTALFETVELDGTDVSRASLHNISICEELKIGIGDKILVYKANMIIPQVLESITKSGSLVAPEQCPICKSRTEVKQDNKSKVLVCTNEMCKGKLLGRLTHFVSKQALNIDGLSESTLDKFIELGWIEDLIDIYTLKNMKTEMLTLDGFGKKSVEKLLKSIEDSRPVKLENFIYSLSISLIGKSASKDLSNFCNGYLCEFVEKIDNKFDFSSCIDGFGKAMNTSLYAWLEINRDKMNKLSKEVVIVRDELTVFAEKTLQGKTFVITGSLQQFANRDELKSKIESLGGKVSGSVSNKTNYLINNDNMSGGSKNKKANELGVNIITEEEFLDIINNK